ncbi:Uma2 family endonuclease [Phormidium yuhuli AB48]|uniref:Uma2 family endonuclease n=1 Tax=Phormidium yuhuli AB48 TaxID=2940671 RepID=A0ABY5API5_9CYAN|nr:Uma2 family endonuclease [Phormidium yuhuli]USR91125.1 Uma2 family endonuclease [Phormidium yuhuli AB48]
MIQTITKPISFDEFVAWYPENADCKYELYNGAIIEMPLATGTHSNITGFITGELHVEIKRLKLPYSIPGACLLKPLDTEFGYQPDVIVLDKEEVAKEPHWPKESIVTLGSSVQLVMEVVSKTWHNDYMKKAGDYEVMGIPEYWIVDYLGLGGRRFLGNPKSPNLSIYTMVDGEYEVKQFREEDRIESGAFPELALTVNDIFNNP